MASHWYVLKVKRFKERPVCERLQERDIDLYYPTLKVKPKNPRAARERPYFPGYMFVRADLEELGNNAFSWLPGTRGLIRFGGEPAVVPEHLIAELKRRLAQIETEGDLILDGLKKGDRVRIVSGPFEGYEAIFDARVPGRERVQVLLAFLSSHPQPVKLDPDDIVKLQ